MDVSEAGRSFIGLFPAGSRAAATASMVTGGILYSFALAFKPTLEPLTRNLVDLYNLPTVSWFFFGCALVFPVWAVRTWATRRERKRDEVIDLVEQTMLRGQFSKAEQKQFYRDIVVQLVNEVKLSGRPKTAEELVGQAVEQQASKQQIT